jgi:hypothetical protein
MTITKNDLNFSYHWKASEVGDDPEVRGRPDSELFNKNEGYEVLSVLNAIGRTHYISRPVLEEIEKYIKRLPDHLLRERVIEMIEQRFFGKGGVNSFV